MFTGKKILILFSIIFQALAEEECDAPCRILRRVTRTNQRLNNITTILHQLQDTVAVLLPTEDPLYNEDQAIQSAWSRRGDDYIISKDCQQVLDRGRNESGIYRIQPLLANQSFLAPCVFNTDDKSGWTVILHRSSANVDFNVDWDSYKKGFGDLATDFWLGLEHIHQITAFQPVELRIDITNQSDFTYVAYYSDFSIGTEDEGYYLKYLGEYSGNALDALSIHLNEKFYTYDRDNAANCSQNNGGWWFDVSCGYSNLNGPYQTDGVKNKNTKAGVAWDSITNLDENWETSTFSAKEARMMLRPKTIDDK